MIRCLSAKDQDRTELLDRRVIEITEELDRRLAGLGFYVLLTSTIRGDGGPHQFRRAVDVRTKHLPMTREAKLQLAADLDAWARARFGPYDHAYVIHEYPDHPNPKLQNPEHWHIQTPPWGAVFPEEGAP
jgi:hypothetical protein